MSEVWGIQAKARRVLGSITSTRVSTKPVVCSVIRALSSADGTMTNPGAKWSG